MCAPAVSKPAVCDMLAAIAAEYSATHLKANAVLQVPRDISEDMLRPFFEPYGEIEHINILRTQRGQSAGDALLIKLAPY